MLFLRQPIQSFLDLGACKEYTIMAKPKNPKKTNGDAGVQPLEATVPTNGAIEATSSDAPAKKSGRKPSIVKSDARPNLVPINVEDEIRRLAYLLAERRGFEPGHETEDWLAAEHEIRQRYHQYTA